MIKLMILGASILQLPAIKTAQEMGFKVIAVDMNPDAIGFKEKDVICENISTIDTPNVLIAAKRHNIDGIMTLASDRPMRTVAAVAKELGLIGISEQTAINTTDKGVMRRVLKDHGIAVPRFYQVDTFEEYLYALNKFDKCCVIKPVDNSGSRGITLLTDFSVDGARKAFHYAQDNSSNSYVLLEEYMNGQEVSVETFSIDGKCHIIQITDKITTGSPHFVETGHSQPSQLPIFDQEEICKLVQAAVMASGIDNGPSHTEIILTKDGPKIVEIGARLGGDNIATHLVPISTGIDLVAVSINSVLGLKVDIIKKHKKGSAIRYLISEPGVVRKVDGLDDAFKSKGVELVEVSCAAGDKIDETKNSNDRIAYVIAKGHDAADAIANCENAKGKIKIELQRK